MKLFLLGAILISFFIFIPASTVEARTENHRKCRGDVTFLSFPSWYEYLDVGEAPSCQVSAIRYRSGSASGQINIGATVGAVLLAVIEILLRVAGIVAVGFIVYGGVLLTISQGAPEKWKAGLATILNGAIGLAIAILAVAIVNLLSNVVLG